MTPAGGNLSVRDLPSLAHKKRELVPTLCVTTLDAASLICHKRLGTRLPLFIERGRAVD